MKFFDFGQSKNRYYNTYFKIFTIIITIPAKAGIYSNCRPFFLKWIPAFAGMTGGGGRRIRKPSDYPGDY